jgi:hypothetical protein
MTPGKISYNCYSGIINARFFQEEGQHILLGPGLAGRAAWYVRNYI